MIYLDKVHMTADSLEELHQFAQNLGMKRSWFQCEETHPHYHILASWRYDLAIEMGAERVSSKFILFAAQKLLEQNEGRN